jgi:putative spermidine/putrescine transport system permease protein
MTSSTVVTESPARGETPAPAPAPAGSGRGPLPLWVTVLLPTLLFITAVFLWPVVTMLARSVTEPPGGLANFEQLFSPALLRILVRTVGVAALVTVISLAAAYPFAYLAATTGPRARRVLLAVAGASLFVSIVVRGYGWLTVLDRSGALNTTLAAIGLERFSTTLVHNFAGVVIGMVQYGIPFMVFPLYDVMRRVDSRLLRAAATLGASPRRAFWRVYVPLTFPGVTAGCTVVFIASLGYYILPAILGGPQNTMIGEFIANQFLSTADFGLGAAAAAMLLAVAVLTFVALQALGRAVVRGPR